MTEPKLKPCPFCGGEAELIWQDIEDWFSGRYVRNYIVGCPNCGFSFRRETKNDVVEKWNARVVAE